MRPCPAPEMKTKASFYLILAASVPLLLTLIAGKARGQSALDGFDPQASSTVGSIAVQRDGKILLGGVFNQVLGVPRNGIARLNLDGTLDNTFNANLDDQSYITAMALQADGKILASGNFRDASIGYMARLDPVTGAAESFGSTGGQPPLVIIIQPDGKILVGGYFTTAGGQPRNFIARLDPVTAIADSFNANIGTGGSRHVDAIALQPDGKVLVGGFFSSVEDSLATAWSG